MGLICLLLAGCSARDSAPEPRKFMRVRNCTFNPDALVLMTVDYRNLTFLFEGGSRFVLPFESRHAALSGYCEMTIELRASPVIRGQEQWTKEWTTTKNPTP